MIAPARPNSPQSLRPISTPAGCPILMRCTDALPLMPPPFPTSLSSWCRVISTTTSAPSVPAARFLAALAEHEMAERGRRRIERHLAEARLPPGKTLDAFDFEAVPVVSKAQVMALAAGDSWLEKAASETSHRSGDTMACGWIILARSKPDSDTIGVFVIPPGTRTLR